MSASTELTGDLAEVVDRLVHDGVAGRIARRDADVWGPDARSEASIRLGWTALHETSRDLVAAILGLRDELRAEGIDRVVLCGMGGSSLAPEVICAAAGVDLVVLDSTDPGQVRRAVVELERTVVVVSSKSGSTVETDSQRRVFEAAFERAGIDAKRRVVIVTDPGSPLERAALDGGYRAVFQADPHVGGRYSALTAFGLVPSGLAGADIQGLLDAATAVAPALEADAADNPGLVLAALMAHSPSGFGHGRLRDKVAIVAGAGLPGFADWAEQLIAESTGKEGKGLLPVAAEADGPEVLSPAGDVVVVHVVANAAVDVAANGTPPVTVTTDGATGTVTGALGAQFLTWEYAVAVAGHLIGINPFDQPDVESAKVAARGLLDAPPAAAATGIADGDVSITASEGLLRPGDTTVGQAVGRLLASVPADGYVAVMAYLDRLAHPGLPAVRAAVARRTERPTTFGWGPRFLHSTGQYHKGGPAVGVFLQIVAAAGLGEDLEVPGREFTFGRLIAAQAAGDADVLAGHGVPVLTLAVSSQAGLDHVVRELSGQDEGGRA